MCHICKKYVYIKAQMSELANVSKVPNLPKEQKMPKVQNVSKVQQKVTFEFFIFWV